MSPTLQYSMYNNIRLLQHSRLIVSCTLYRASTEILGKLLVQVLYKLLSLTLFIKNNNSRLFSTLKLETCKIVKITALYFKHMLKMDEVFNYKSKIEYFRNTYAALSLIVWRKH